MRDLGSGHTTRMVITNIRYDSGIPDDRFTERYLSQ
jgi:hypothetical protein